jgi:zinc transporter, ZIP family
MEARGAVEPATGTLQRVPAWALGLVPLLLIAAGIAVFAGLGGPGLGKRTGPPIENLKVERTVLHPGQIELTVRNDGPDPVTIAQAIVNDSYVDFTSSKREVGRLAATKVDIAYPWIEAESYSVQLVTSTGGTIDHEIPLATETQDRGSDFYGLMALLGLYVGIIPVTLGMLWLPFIRRISAAWMRFLLALTIGLLAFLAIDATLEGINVAGQGSQAFGGASLVFLGAAVSYLALTAVGQWPGARRRSAASGAAAGWSVALMVAVAIGLHNLGEGLAIGSSYAVGALALGAFLVIGFAIHNTTEGLAIVAPLATGKPSLTRLATLGLVAGAPAIVGAWIGAAAYNSSLAAFLLGAGVGAIVQVIQQLTPAIRDRSGAALRPLTIAGLLAGFAVLYLTSLLVNF